MEGWVSGHGSLRDGRQAFSPVSLTLGIHQGAGLSAFFYGDDVDRFAPCRSLQAGNHVLQGIQLIKSQFPVEDRLRLFSAYQSLLEALYERHGFLHLAHLCNLRVELFVVQGCSVKCLSYQVDVLLLPSGILCSSEDGEFLWFLGVEGDVLALVLLLL